MDKNFIKASILSVSSSMFFSLFIILILKSEYIEFTFFLSSFILFIISYLFIKMKNQKIYLPNKSTIETSLLFSISLLLFLYFMSSNNIIILESIVSFNIIVFVLIHAIRHKDIIDRNAFKFLLIGMIFITLSLFLLYNFSSVLRSLSFLIISIIIMILIGASSYAMSHKIKHTKNKFNFLLWVSLVIFILSSLSLVFNIQGKINNNIIIYSLLSGIVLFLFLYSFIEAFDKLKTYDGKSRFSKTIIISILSETDILFVSLFYLIFIGTINPYIIIGIIFLFLGLAVISFIDREKDIVI